MTHPGASRSASARMSVTRQVGSRAAMEAGQFISISSLDFAVGTRPALSYSGMKNLGFEADLKSATYIDRAGRSLLQLVHRNGVGF